MEKQKILDIFMKSEALLEGHFLLTSGLHSPQYFQCAKVLQYPRYTEQLCCVIADHFKDSNIHTVISPAIGGIVVGQEVARLLGVRSIFAERENTQMSLRRGFDVKPGENVLVVEDVVTTGGSVKEVIELVKSAGSSLAGVGFIVDRSSGKAKFGSDQFSVLQMEVVVYQPDQCPLCKQGLPLVKPGSRKAV
ncbi:orotate phosphoribosyltransferase [candidate division KSB1 bacterium]|nr:orotate phosphoribosyltransferase [candidate division KSB1 bacterium]